MKYLMLVITVLFIISCTPKLENQIVGKWKMYKVIQDGNDVTKAHNPEKERFFELYHDQTFMSDGRPYGKNTGKYVLEIQKKTLFLDSDVGPEDDSNWYISIQNDTMTWQGYGTAWAERFQVIHVRE